MAQQPTSTTNEIDNELKVNRLTLLSMGLVYPAVHFTMVFIDETLVFPSYALFLFPILFIGTYLLSFRSKFIQKNIEGIIIFLFAIQMVFIAYLLYLNNAPREITFCYWVYALLTSNSINKKKLFHYYIFFNFALSALTLIYIGDTPQTPAYLSIIWYTLILFFIYLAISTKLKTQAEFKAAQQGIQDQRDEVEELMNSFSAMVCYKDSNNRITHLNQAMADFLGKPKAFFKNVSMYEIISKGRAHTYHEEDLQIIKTGKSILGAIEEVITPLGEKRWLRSDKKPFYAKDGSIKGVVIFSVDITEQTIEKQRLKQSEDLFRRIFDKAPYGVFIMDLSRKIIHANNSACNLLGYDIDDLAIQSLDDLAYDHSKIDVVEVYEELSPEQPFANREIILSKKDKTAFNINLLATQIKDSNDIPIFNLGMLENISEKRQAEERLQEYSQNLEESNKDLEQFAYIISHDLKEPLRMMTSYTQLLKRRYSDSFDETGDEFMDYIVNGAKRMNDLINDLLAYSRVGRDKRARKFINLVDLIQVIQSNLKMISEEKNAEIIINDVLPLTYCNKPQITALFQNLINNSIKYSREGVPPKVEIGVTKKKKHWEFYIKDNGIGIAQENLDKIFLIFQRLHANNEYSGTGIGLAIAKRIVLTHDGDIWARSIEGEGTTFYFTLPIVSEKQAEAMIE
jgi:PAS domain S-box-containing protein